MREYASRGRRTGRVVRGRVRGGDGFVRGLLLGKGE
jgi:hypothetical protein